MLQDGLHGEPQGVATLVDGIDEPLGSIDFALDKRDGFLLRFVGVLRCCITRHHFPVFVGDPQLGRISAIDLEAQFIVLHRHVKIGHHRLNDTGGVGAAVARFGVEAGHLFHSQLERIFIDLQA